MTWSEWADGEAAAIRAAGQWRAPRDLDAAGPEGKLAPDGRPVVSFASNDYLGLTQHPAVIAAAQAALSRWGAGSGSARLIVGSRPIHTELEVSLAEWKHAEAAVCFPTGFAANLGVLTAFGGPGVQIYSDELNHASIIDGSRLARADVTVYRHGDAEHLDALLRNGEHARAIVVTDTVFSMDGDVAPVDDLVDACARRGALLVLDEAHAVLGPDPDLHEVDALRVGTLSKTLGALGGFVAGPRRFTDLLVNRARSYIFTTASTPADAAAALAAVGIVRSEEGAALRARLQALVERVRPGHPSPIVPVVIGDERATLAAAQTLLEQGLLVPAIRPPTVAPGTSRLRVALSAAHTDAQVDTLVAALAALAAFVTRPNRLVVVTGTGTEVGKTWWTAATAQSLRLRGVAVAARKPVQSYAPDDTSTDADVLAAATGVDPHTVCPPAGWLPIAMAPPIAAAALGLPPFTIDDLVATIAWPDESAIGFVESAGGARSPIAADGDTVDVVRALGPDAVLVVAHAGLGVINGVRSTLDALGDVPTVVALNYYDEADAVHRANHDWLVTRDAFDVVLDPGELVDRWA